MRRPDFLVVGLSHHTAPLALRERLAVAPDSLPAELSAMRESSASVEGLLLSTCNRVEFYAVSPDPGGTAERAKQFLERRAGGEPVLPALYVHHGDAAVRHAFRVAASLDSLVVGEAQILGQLKQAFGVADRTGSLGTLMRRCFDASFGVAKRVRTETKISEGAVSVSSVAIELALRIFGDLHHRRVLLVGAGKMSEAAARSLRAKGAELVVVNRTGERAEDLAKRFEARAADMANLEHELSEADVVIASTASTGFLLTEEIIGRVVRARRHRPLFVIDIAVPRNVDPRIGHLDNVFVYDLDDLQQVAAANLDRRRLEVGAAEEIVRAEVAQFEAWRRSLDMTPTIVALRKQFETLARAELARSLPRVGIMVPEQVRMIEAMCEAIVNKLLHRPLTELRRGASGDDPSELVDAVRRLFALDAGESQDTSEEAENEGEPAPVGPERTRGSS